MTDKTGQKVMERMNRAGIVTATAMATEKKQSLKNPFPNGSAVSNILHAKTIHNVVVHPYARWVAMDFGVALTTRSVSPGMDGAAGVVRAVLVQRVVGRRIRQHGGFASHNTFTRKHFTDTLHG